MKTFNQQKQLYNFQGRRSQIKGRSSLNQSQLSNLSMQEQYEQYQKKQMQMKIKDSLNNLKSIISQNVAFRKGDISGKPSALSNTKFFSNLAGIKNHYQEKIENKDLLSADTNNKLQPKGFQINKSLRNLSIITQKQEISNQNKGLQFIKNGMKDEFSAHKPLYQRYFSENANNFIKTIQDPFDPKLRSKILKSDNEYSKFVQSYFNKPKLYRQKQNQLKKNGSLSTNTSTQNLFTFEGRDFLTLNKQQSDIEKNYISQISDLDNFQENHMIDTLNKFQYGQMAYIQKKKVDVEKTRMARVIQIENEKRKNLATPFSRTHTSGGFRCTTANTVSNQAERINLNDQLSVQQSNHQSQQQGVQAQTNSHYVSNSYSSSQKLQKRLENQTKKGYHVIKRNQSEHALAYHQEDLIRDESDDSSNASRTEATLDVLYSESIYIQNRLVSDNQDGLIKKLKQLIRLENLKKNVLEANLYKLEHR
ncbi:hypothetical protein TTHERM_00388540 (macronuclear) [Tetrahymena thermophila SB210]|uniref:Uncharacterized protein n=1 Tax=Tetrahymena thermophila (strain SB210) TaxID=312017 RepID=Q23RD5_TETTS|nr:hypothetical protein TTHERM_00388540 [Tetrahymena thermophila SB210]EAR99113.2 hypothetical protein TTHERM_00388540 [Tetrahymena thermophila SB210]|eukprot:XP_001019358.2 hypothetical protein TTHERM_00388540 [Tetrahymena thermophila SB210]